MNMKERIGDQLPKKMYSVFILLVVFHRFRFGFCEREELKIQRVAKNRKFDFPPLKTIRVLSERLCLLQCQYENKCLSLVTYNENDSCVCNLLSKRQSRSGAGLTEASGHTYYEIDLKPECKIDSNLRGEKISHCTFPECDMKDCYDWFKLGYGQNGLYTVCFDETIVTVYCDMENGGWTVFQNRYDGSIDFNRVWSKYKEGFGNVKGEFWLGNKYLHQLSALGESWLRITATSMSGKQGDTILGNVTIGDGGNRYRLTFGDVVGGTIPLHYHENENSMNGRFFSTRDDDNDETADIHCSEKYGAWWMDKCFTISLNHKYPDGSETAVYAEAMKWEALDMTSYVSSSQMMIKRRK